MRSIVAVVAAALSACGPSDGPPTAAEVKELADTACPQVIAPYFYRVEKDGKRSHFLGTRHVGVSLAKFPPHIEAALRASKVAVFESLVKEPAKAAPGSGSGVAAASAAPPGHAPTPAVGAGSAETAEQVLGPELWAKYRGLVGSDVAARTTSVRTAMGVLVLLYEDKTATLDRELQELAGRLGLELVALEDEERTAEVGASLMDADNLRELVGAVRQRTDLRISTRRDLTTYCAGTREEVRGTAKPAGSHIDDVNAERNLAWLDKLEELLGRGGAFVAVGNAHLIGPGSVLELLRARGYRVERLPQPG